MSIQALQEKIRAKKTPIALGLCPEVAQLNARVLKNFTDMYGDCPMAKSEAMRYQGCQALEAAADKLPAVVLKAENYLRFGAMGFDVLVNLTGIAKSRGFYTIVDCRASLPEAWLEGLANADAITVNPYAGGDCCAVDDDHAVFAVVRTANVSCSDVQNLMSGDRRLYLAVADQMARHGAGLMAETGYSLDIKELRKRCDKSFLLLTHCDSENAVHAFDDYGHGALVVDDTLQYAADAAAVDDAVKAMKHWVSVM